MVTRAIIAGCGGYLPERVVSNDGLAEAFGIETSDAWIVERTGIRQRHIAAPGETASAMGAAAARQALERAGIPGEAVDLVVCATATPDSAFPATAVRIQAALGSSRGFAFDIAAACTGFVYALGVADALIRTGQARCAVVVGTEVFSRILDWTDRGTCVLFGDGAGAVVMEPMEGQGTTADRGLLGFALRCDGTKQDLLYVDGGPSTTGTVGKLRMQGNQVFKHAVINISEAVTAAAKAAGVEVSDVDWFIPHQANERILKGVANRLGIDEQKVIQTVGDHANTSAASIPLALAQGVADGRIGKGDLLLLEAMGGGLTWGACVVRL